MDRAYRALDQIQKKTQSENLFVISLPFKEYNMTFLMYLAATYFFS